MTKITQISMNSPASQDQRFSYRFSESESYFTTQSPQGIQPLSPSNNDWNTSLESVNAEFETEEERQIQSSSSLFDFDRVSRLRQVMNEEDNNIHTESRLTHEPSRNTCVFLQGPSLAARERSFRTNLQARALALTRSRSAKPDLAVRFNQAVTEIEPDDRARLDETTPDVPTNGEQTFEKGYESLAEFASRLEESIRMLKTTDIALEADDKQIVSNELTRSPPIFQKEPSFASKKDTEPLTVHFEKTLRSMNGYSSDSSFSGALKKSFLTDTEQETARISNQETKESIEAARIALRENEQPSVTTADVVATNNPAATTDIAVQAKQSESPENQPIPSPYKRSRSFHTDGWKQTANDESLTGDMLTEESIAAQELKARETYIKAMHEHQALLRSGKDEYAAEVVESQKKLQMCFAKIEYWEKLKDDFLANPSLFSPEIRGEIADAISSEPHRGVSFVVSQDTDFVGAQELKAREEYIKAMRDHQDLIMARVKPDSIAWIESQRRQKQCLAKLQYWEARNNGLDPVNVEEQGLEQGHRKFATIANPPYISLGTHEAPSKKPVYVVSLENKGDRNKSDSLLDKIAKNVQQRFRASKSEPPKVVLQNIGSDISQLDGVDGCACNSLEIFCNVLWSASQKPIGKEARSRSGTSDGDYDPSSDKHPKDSKGVKKRQKEKAKRGNNDRCVGSRQSTRKNSESSAQSGDKCLSTSGAKNQVAQPEHQKHETTAKDSMNAIITNQATQILRHLSIGTTFSNDDCDSLPRTPENRSDDKNDQLSEHTTIPCEKPKSFQDDGLGSDNDTDTFSTTYENRSKIQGLDENGVVLNQHNGPPRKVPVNASLDYPDDMTDVSYLINEDGGVVNMICGY